VSEKDNLIIFPKVLLPDQIELGSQIIQLYLALSGINGFAFFSIKNREWQAAFPVLRNRSNRITFLNRF